MLLTGPNNDCVYTGAYCVEVFGCLRELDIKFRVCTIVFTSANQSGMNSWKTLMQQVIHIQQAYNGLAGKTFTRYRNQVGMYSSP